MVSELIAGRYEVEEMLGSGGMSNVYKARDRRLDRQVALKALHSRFEGDEGYVTRFRREARAVAQLSHPNIVTVIDRVDDHGRQFIVFEYVEGETLKQLIEREAPLAVDRAVELVLEIAGALEFAHRQNLVHRDVKPQNVLVNSRGEVKVTDFGIARSLEIEHGITETGTMLGTSDYLSPEQARGIAATPASDIYSLGVVLYELLTGEVPFRGDGPLAVAMQHVNAPPPDLLDSRPTLSPRLAAAVRRSLAKDPEDRFASMAAFADELRQCLDAPAGFDEQATLVEMRPPQRRSPHTTRRRTVPVTAILVTLGLLAAIVAAALALFDNNNGAKTHTALSSGPDHSTMTLRGAGNYDPSGPADAHADTAGAATDGNPSTYWYTQIYASPDFGKLKRGLGLRLNAGAEVELKQLTVTTRTPGFEAVILAGDSPGSGFRQDSKPQTVRSSTTFALQGATARYYVLWITRLPPGNKAEVNEITASR
jgi:serine/threonine-protein kinase